MIRTIPPAISTFFPKRRPNLLPATKPRNDNKKVILPITIIGKIIETPKSAKLTPTARASIFVAIDSA